MVLYPMDMVCFSGSANGFGLILVRLCWESFPALPQIFSGSAPDLFRLCPNLRPRPSTGSFLQIIYDIGTEFLFFHCFATKMLFLFCKSMIPVRFCSILPLHSCASIKTRFKALLKTQYLTLGPNF